MEKLIKLFPLLPEEKDGGKLAIALVFYICVPPIASMILGFILGLTIILSPLAILVGLAGTAYMVLGIVFAVLKYLGKDITSNNNTENTENTDQ